MVGEAVDRLFDAGRAAVLVVRNRVAAWIGLSGPEYWGPAEVVYWLLVVSTMLRSVARRRFAPTHWHRVRDRRSCGPILAAVPPAACRRWREPWERAVTPDTEVQISEKSYGVAVTLSMVFGLLGVQHFYLGRILLGLTDVALSVGFVILVFFTDDPGLVILGIIFFVADCVHTLVTTILLFTGNFKDGAGAVVAYPGQFAGIKGP